MQPVLIGARDTGGNLQTVPLQTHADGVGTPGNTSNGSLSTVNVPLLFNEATYDRQRGNTSVAALGSASRTANVSVSPANYNARGIKVTVDVTIPGTGSITVAIAYRDAVSGKTITILSSAAITTASTVVLTVYPGLAAVANVSANDVLPRDFSIVVTHNNANPITYSVGYQLIV